MLVLEFLLLEKVDGDAVTSIDSVIKDLLFNIANVDCGLSRDVLVMIVKLGLCNLQTSLQSLEMGDFIFGPFAVAFLNFLWT